MDSRKTAAMAAGAPLNYFREVFFLQYNWIALLAATAFSLVALSPFPLLAIVGLELMYLSVVPSNPRFQRWVRSRLQVFEWRRRQLELAELLESMPPHVQQRYLLLQRMCSSIRLNHDQLSSTSRVLLVQIENRLLGLLRSYLRLLSTADQYHAYLATPDAKAVALEIENADGALKSTAATEIQDIDRKRLEILKERSVKLKKISDNTRTADAQCAAIEDMVKLMHEQSMTLRDLNPITTRLDTLLEDAQRTETTVKEIEAYVTADRELE